MPSASTRRELEFFPRPGLQVSILAAVSGEGSLATYLATLALTARVCAPVLVDSALGRSSRRSCDRRIDWWSKKALALADARLIVLGRENIAPDENYVVMSNHQSNFDILAVFQAYPGSLRMVAKAELRKLPLLGTAMEASEFIFVDRGNNAEARRALDIAAERIGSGVSVWIAPEGTRSPNGEVGAFKKGGFMLALAAGVRILPATVDGTREILPVKSTRVRRGKTITVRFHAPLDPADYGLERRDEMMSAVRDAIAPGA